MVKAIDKSNSPLWIRILVWILVAGLMAAAVFMAIGVITSIATWGDPPPPMTITADDLPPEILAELEAQMAEANQNEGGVVTGNEDDDEGIVFGTDLTAEDDDNQDESE
ncbi:MAG: hypothetical protein FWC86_00240 [Coriobacteriia bacterium]|nr:hypothetical protein [Coriobacteriia bacterium]